MTIRKGSVCNIERERAVSASGNLPSFRVSLSSARYTRPHSLLTPVEETLEYRQYSFVFTPHLLAVFLAVPASSVKATPGRVVMRG